MQMFFTRANFFFSIKEVQDNAQSGNALCRNRCPCGAFDTHVKKQDKGKIQSDIRKCGYR